MQQISIRTFARTEMINITDKVQRALEDEMAGATVAKALVASVCMVFVPHTTAAVTINENADPAVPADILAELNKVVPFEDGYAHGEGNSAAHIKAVLVGPSVSVPVQNGRLCLGTWQGIFFCEFDGPRQRQVWIQTH